MMQFSEIEQRRSAVGIEQKALCKKAGVHQMTYSRLKTRPEFGTTEKTLTKLETALDALVAERMRKLKEATGEQANG
jgi:predicted transcriptional regulator